MYASDSAIKPAPSGTNTDWSLAAGGGVKASDLYAAKKDTYTALRLDVPDDAFYDVTFTITGGVADTRSDIGYVEVNDRLGVERLTDNGVLSDYGWWGGSDAYTQKTGLQAGSDYVTSGSDHSMTSMTKTYTVTGLRGTNIQFI